VTSQMPLLTDDGQVLAALIEIPPIGLPERRYSARVWDETDVRQVMRTKGSRLLLVHPPSLGPPRSDWPVFLMQLAEGAEAEWLVPVYRAQRLQIYRAAWCQGAP